MKLAKLSPHREPLQFCKVRKTANSQRPDRFVPDIAKQIGTRQVIAIELLGMRALLLGKIHRAAHGHNAKKVFDRTSDRNADGIAGAIWRVCVINGGGRAQRRFATLENIYV